MRRSAILKCIYGCIYIITRSIHISIYMTVIRWQGLRVSFEAEALQRCLKLSIIVCIWNWIDYEDITAFVDNDDDDDEAGDENEDDDDAAMHEYTYILALVLSCFRLDSFTSSLRYPRQKVSISYRKLYLLSYYYHNISHYIKSIANILVNT